MNSTLDRLCHRHLGLMKKYFLNGCMCLQRLVLGQWLSHLVNMRHKLYQPEKPASNNISVVSSKIPEDQEVNLKPKLGLFDLHMWQRETALAEQDGGSYIWHGSKTNSWKQHSGGKAYIAKSQGQFKIKVSQCPLGGHYLPVPKQLSRWCFLDWNIS